MDLERLRQTLSSRADATCEQVSVNQRHLIDKILARYSAEFTVYREVLQNSNDAGAHSMTIDFLSDDHHHNHNHPHHKRASKLVLKNDGRPFAPADWGRLKSIAEGNPDEQKIGFFGVGFYSLFSICEEPMVVSGGQCLSFYWQRDQLFTRMAQTDAADALDSSTTVIYLVLREPLDLPNMDSFAQFLAKSILFTASLGNVAVTVDGKLAFGITKKTSPEQPIASPLLKATTRPHGIFQISHLSMVTVQLILDKRYSSEPESKGFFEDLWRHARESLSKDSELYESVRRPGTFNVFCRLFHATCSVHTSAKVSREMERITKKKPARQVCLSALYSSHAELSVSDASSANHKVRHPVLFGVLPAASGSLPTGKLFIGFETHQTSGVAVHLSGPFIPTVERESIDFVDSAVRLWNQECLGASGLLCRAIWDHEIDALQRHTYDLASAAHLLQAFSFAKTSPLSVVGELVAAHYIHHPGLMVPSTAGVRRVEDLRLVPNNMRSFLITTPQPLSDSLDGLLSMVSGVQAAGAEDLAQELQSRIFSDEETVNALKWCLRQRAAIQPSTGRALLTLLTLPTGSGNTLKPLASVSYYCREKCNWPLPEDCASEQFSDRLTGSEWEAFRVKPLPVDVWIQFLVDNRRLDRRVCEEVLIHLSSRGADASVIAVLSAVPCIPSQDGKLLVPRQAFFEDVLSFGMSLPAVCLQRRSLVSDSLLKELGVKSHLPADELLSLIRSSHWDTRRLIKYLSTIQDDLSAADLDQLKQTPFAPDPSPATHRPDARHRLDEMHRDSRAARELQLPVFTQADLGDEQQVRLLRVLGFNFFIPFPVLLSGIHNSPSRLLLYEYLFEHFEMYRPAIAGDRSISIVLCQDGAFRAASQCFTDPRAALLGFPVVHEAIAGPAERCLQVRRCPHGQLVVSQVASGEVRVDCCGAVLQFMADCEYSQEDYHRLRSTQFVNTNKQRSSPKEAFFKVPTEFAALFGEVERTLYADAPRVRQFLAACGVQEQPSANELILVFAQSPEPLLLTLGTKKYAALLKLFAVHMDDVSDAARRQFRSSQCLLGIVHEAQEASLYHLDSVFVGDDAVSQRQFAIPVAPPDLDSFYADLGCKSVSECIQSDWFKEGAEGEDEETEHWRGLVKKRSSLIAKEGLKIAAEEAGQRLGRLLFAKVGRLTIGKRFQQLATKTFPTSACYDHRSHTVYITTQPDAFDVAGCIVSALKQYHGKGSLLSDTLLVSTLLSMPVETLKERGFIDGKIIVDGEDGDGGGGGGGEGEEELEQLSVKLEKRPPMEAKHQPMEAKHQPTETKHQPTETKHQPTETKHQPIETKHPRQPEQATKERKPRLLEKLLSVLTGKSGGKDLQHADKSDVLREGINATRPNQGHTIYKEQETKRRGPILPPKDPLSDTNLEGECAIASDLVCSGTINGFEFYSVPGAAAKQADEQPNQDMAAVLKTLCAVFGADPRTLHIFNDPCSRSIAFNRGGSLFFNAHYMPAERALVFWYMTCCHELAHNFCTLHDMRHEHYMMSYAEQYLERLLPYL